MKYDISVCLISTNELAVLKNCLDSIVKYEKYNCSIEIVVVDNASTDGTEDYLRDNNFKIPLKYVKNTKKLSFAANNNIAMSIAQGQYYLILNPDTIIIENAIDRMKQYLDNNNSVACVAPKLLYEDYSFQENCRKFPKVRYLISSRLNSLGLKIFTKANKDYQLVNQSINEPMYVDWVLGACMLIRSSIIEDIGGFDEKYIYYFEDTDLCWRMKSHGWQISYLPSAEVIHLYKRQAAESFLNRKAILQFYTITIFYFKNYFKIIS